jgi:4-amino-4-deoxy-L-arabinose transferase-like glycosyltransferase
VFLWCPLFIGLGQTDLQSDEAIYSYAIERILETGDWLTPRSIPFDGPFLEKPPLKFWLVALGIRAGLLPQDEFGFRVLDALFGSIAFGYVFLLGHQMAGAICGFVAVLILFAVPSLLFDHGLRTSNMEAALVLAYCGGLFHFVRWTESTESRRSSRHAAATVAYFTMGFMMKFVGVLFLPLVCAISFWWRGPQLLEARSRWKQWVVPAAVALVVVLPWFMWQAGRSDGLWTSMWVEQVYGRFTGVLDARRALPWHQYFSQSLEELSWAGSHWISALGLVVLGYQAFVMHHWLARVLLVWLVVPFCLLSIPTSKYFHYVYPFLPPLAIGAGAAAAIVFRSIERLASGAAATLAKQAPRVFQQPIGGWASKGLVLVGSFAALIGLWTAANGQVSLEIGGVRVFRNSSVVRPLLFATILIGLSRHDRIPTKGIAIAATAAILPLGTYVRTFDRLAEERYPLRALSDCALRTDGVRHETHVYLGSYDQLLNHSPYYYLRHVGPWVYFGGRPRNEELDVRLYVPGQQALAIMPTGDYRLLAEQLTRRELSVPKAVLLGNDNVLLLPGPLAGCSESWVAAAGKTVDDL